MGNLRLTLACGDYDLTRALIDGSVQPYGLVVPASYSPNTPHKFRMDVWWRGRQEKAAEVGFLADRLARIGIEDKLLEQQKKELPVVTPDAALDSDRN